MNIRLPLPKEDIKVGDTVKIIYQENGQTMVKQVVITTVDKVNGTAYGNERGRN